MIKAVKIENFGPYDGQHILPFRPTRNDIQGPNESGKTSLVDAVAWVLTGKASDGSAITLERIHTGREYLRVEVMTSKGNVLGRSLTKEGGKRTYTKNQGDTQPTTYDKEADYQAAIKMPPIDLLLSILAPRYALGVLGSGNAQGLRDLLHRVLPGVGNLEAEARAAMEKAGQDPDSGKFTLDISAAEEMRKKANKAASDTAAIATLKRTELEALQAQATSAPTEEAASKADPKLAEELEAKYRESGKKIEELLVEESKSDFDAPIESAAFQWRFYQYALSQVRKDARCFCCGTSLEKVKDKMDKLFLEKMVKAKSEVERMRATREDESRKLKQQRELEIKQLRGERERLWVKLEEQKKLLTLGKAGAKKVAGDLGMSLEERRRQLEALEKELHKCGQEAAYAEALVQALRIAPARVAQARVAALELPSTMRLEFLSEPKRGEPFVKLLYRGIEAHLASDGAEIAIDLAFRLALRRVTKLGWLPVFIDRTESVAADRLETPLGQSFFLRHKEAPASIPEGDLSSAPQETQAKEGFSALKEELTRLLELEDKGNGGRASNLTAEMREHMASAEKSGDTGALNAMIAYLTEEERE